MKWLAVAAALTLTAAPAHGQATIWTHPDSHYSLDITGWSPVDMEMEGHEIAAFGRGGPHGRSLVCLINEAAAPPVISQSQEIANAHPQVFQPTARDGDIVLNLRRLRVGGVVIAAFSLSNRERGYIDAYRYFALSKPVTFTQISCGGRNPTEIDLAEFERLLDSISFAEPSP